MISRALTALLCLTSALVLPACRSEPAGDDTDDAPVMGFDSSTIRLFGARDTVVLRVELAVTPEQRTMGLMERRQLGERAGMLFVHDSIQPADAGFWMFRTRIPLDIAFLDDGGTIRSVRTMTPCEATLAQGCPTHAPGVPYRYALEVNAGVFSRYNIVVGDSVDLGEVATRVPTATRSRTVAP